MNVAHPKIAIIGAGIIGLSCAWELLKRGAEVSVFDKQWPPVGASWAAAGMLAPAFEAAGESAADPAFFDLCLRSARMWRGFAEEIEAASGQGVGYCEGPALAVALDEAEAERLLRLEARLVEGGLTAERLSRRDIGSLERGVSPDFELALALSSDGRVDPRRTVLALREAIERAGGVFEIVPEGVSGSQLTEGFDACLEASGVGDGAGPVQAVQGVMLAFRRADMALDHVVRCGAEYAVPRGEHVLVGATVGEVADARSYLLSRAVRFLPRIRSAALVDQWRGFRPATPDRLPIMGRGSGVRTFVARGHYRNGILLAPVTAEIMAEVILGGELADFVAAFSPARFGATA